jgi:IS1 family transposase
VRDLEIDEFWSFVGSKQRPRWTWYGFDRQRKRVVAYVNGRRTDQECRRLMKQMSRCQVSCFHTDGWPSYRRVLPQTRHKVSKGGTLQIERHNFNFRTRLKRLQRRTICFSRSEELHDAVIKLFVHHSSTSQRGKIEIYTPDMEQKLSAVGHRALPIFYTHPEVTGRNPTIEYSSELVKNPVNPQALTPKVTIGGLSSGAIHKEYPLMGIVGRPSVVHFAGVTQWTYTGKQMNGVRLIQIHPTTAQAAGIKDGDAVIVESPRGAATGTALIWQGIREDTIFVPNTFGPMQKMAQELGTPEYEPANHLLDDRYYDNLSGQQAYKCFACRVRKA